MQIHKMNNIIKPKYPKTDDRFTIYGHLNSKCCQESQLYP